MPSGKLFGNMIPGILNKLYKGDDLGDDSKSFSFVLQAPEYLPFMDKVSPLLVDDPRVSGLIINIQDAEISDRDLDILGQDIADLKSRKNLRMSLACRRKLPNIRAAFVDNQVYDRYEDECRRSIALAKSLGISEVLTYSCLLYTSPSPRDH
jgi:hypothetical protein